ncbi:hypothetical protein J1605_009059 [Eschrichtius robustus]|uniref:Uncharacterized protein n=1 Tax=Eschrichtius robustus TaxID=9764 RepID=A0AB34GU62_ESCRO|nr:hypothetical protein J1605_009059 [Eschrichtius robustus]
MGGATGPEQDGKE